MGLAWSKIKKPFRDFNLDRRVDKALEAPKQKTTSRRREAPDSDLYRKDDKLIGRVNLTHLRSLTEPTTQAEPLLGSRPKLSRDPVVEPEFGYYNITDSKDIPVGRTTLPRLLDLLGKVAPPHMSGTPPARAQESQTGKAEKPTAQDVSLTERNTAVVSLTEDKITALSQEYKLDREVIAAISSRFRLFDLHIPNPRTPTVKRMQLLSERLRMGSATTLSLDDEVPKGTPPDKQFIEGGSATEITKSKRLDKNFSLLSSSDKQSKK